MLAEERRAGNGRILPALELERHAQGGELAHGRMAEALDKLARGNVFAAAFAGAFSIWLVWRATRGEEAA